MAIRVIIFNCIMLLVMRFKALYHVFYVIFSLLYSPLFHAFLSFSIPPSHITKYVPLLTAYLGTNKVATKVTGSGAFLRADNFSAVHAVVDQFMLYCLKKHCLIIFPIIHSFVHLFIHGKNCKHAM